MKMIDLFVTNLTQRSIVFGMKTIDLFVTISQKNQSSSYQTELDIAEDDYSLLSHLFPVGSSVSGWAEFPKDM